MNLNIFGIVLFLIWFFIFIPLASKEKKQRRR